MASIKKQANGKWRAMVFKDGQRPSKVFLTKREAESWAARIETELDAGSAEKPSSHHTLADALKKYTEEISPTKKGERWELIRAKAFVASGHPLFSMRIGRVQPEDINAWRDARLKSVAAGSVRRELGMISAVFEAARREWRWIESNPVRDVRKPREADHREVVITRRQIRAMCSALGYRRGSVRSVRQAVAVCFLFALRTGCRAGELTSLAWASVADRHVSVDGKTGKRDVPVTRKARRLLNQMTGFDPKMVFGVGAASLDTLFRRARDEAGLSGFTFHDTRHTAATWLAPKIDVLTLCKVFGWKSPKMAMTYYNPKASDIADRLESTQLPSGVVSR